MATGPKPFADSILVLSKDDGGPLVSNPLLPGFDPLKNFSRGIRLQFGLSPDVTSIQYCCDGNAPRTYLEQACPDYPGLYPVIMEMRRAQGDVVTKEWIRRNLHRNPDDLWCSACKDEYAFFTEVVAPFLHAVAGIIAYVPVFGTAVAFVLNSAVSLAEGKRIDQALLDSARGALPGQPASTMAFDAAVAIAQDQPIDNVLIDALPIDEQVKNCCKSAARVMRALAAGQPISDVTIQEIYYQLPPASQKVMQTAQRIANGENVGDIAAQEGAAYLVGASKESINEYLANAGYQELLNHVPPDIRDGINAGFALGYAMKAQRGAPIGTMTLGRAERAVDRTRNDGLVERGLSIALDNPEIQKRRALSRFLPQITTNDDWRRGFDIGTAVAQGSSANGPGQEAVRDSLGGIAARNGFAAARDLQYRITARSALYTQKAVDHTYIIDTVKDIQNQQEYGEMATALGRVISESQRAELRDAATRGRAIAEADPRVMIARMGKDSAEFKWGFDIGSAVCRGSDFDGPGQAAMRMRIGPIGGVGVLGTGIGTNEAVAGFNVAQALQHGITKAAAAGMIPSSNPSVAMGQLVATGLSGSSVPDAQKIGTIQDIVANSGAAAGASQVIEQKTGLWTRFLRFFGLA